MDSPTHAPNLFPVRLGYGDTTANIEPTWGGRREGAGRKQAVDAPVRRTVYLSQRHVDLITRHQQQGATFSEALRQLLDKNASSSVESEPVGHSV